MTSDGVVVAFTQRRVEAALGVLTDHLGGSPQVRVHVCVEVDRETLARLDPAAWDELIPWQELIPGIYHTVYRSKAPGSVMIQACHSLSRADLPPGAAWPPPPPSREHRVLKG